MTHGPTSHAHRLCHGLCSWPRFQPPARASQLLLQPRLINIHQHSSPPPNTSHLPSRELVALVPRGVESISVHLDRLSALLHPSLPRSNGSAPSAVWSRARTTTSTTRLSPIASESRTRAKRRTDTRYPISSIAIHRPSAARDRCCLAHHVLSLQHGAEGDVASLVFWAQHA